MSAVRATPTAHTKPDVVEVKRLEAVWEQLPLDASLEQQVQRLARIATNIFAAPMGTVSLIDATAQIFACQVGFDVAQVDRQESFCNHTIASDEVLVVLNANHESSSTNKTRIRVDNKPVTVTKPSDDPREPNTLSTDVSP